MKKRKNLLNKVWDSFNVMPSQNQLPEIDSIYGDLYQETLDELKGEFNRARLSYEEVKQIHTKINLNEPLTPNELKILGLIQID